jgi:hypothetical protein
VADVADPLPLLQALGATSDEVAANLRAAGVKGKARLKRSCPLAVFMQVRGFTNASVAGSTLEWGRGHLALLPGPCAEFAHRFDHGDYHELAGACSDLEG